MKALWFPVLLAAAAFWCMPMNDAAAQWNNAPYQPSFRGPSDGVGMSPGYRQVIILDRLSDSISRNNLHRLPSGLLSNVIREDGQAFLATPDGLPVAPTRFVTRSSGFGYGGADAYLGRASSVAPYRAGLHASIAFNDWWSMVADTPRPTGGSFSASPIDGWISQLDSL